MIEIIKAVSFDAKLIIMDEPTSSLDSEETEALFSIIRRLKGQGVSIVYISHRMDEIFQICDQVSVFRDGRFVGSEAVANVDREKLISMMVGRTVKNIFPKTECAIGEPVLRVEQLSGRGFSDISFEVRAGEILGISGLVGSGRSETMRALIGLDPLSSGRVYLSCQEIRIKSVRWALRQGICMVNEDRKNYGLVLHRSVRENISLPNLRERHRKLLINKRREARETGDSARALTVKSSSIEQDAYSLSGGNQQKVVLAKWLMSRPKVLILDEPTRGVDVGAKSEIHAMMGRLAAEGMAIVMISSELPEIIGISDRILIYREGRISGEVLREDILSGKENQETILAREL
jgi:ribose transport system ATP-binding protein/inositol transport system ATP-binding protein